MKKLLTLTIMAGMLAVAANGAWADGPYPTALTNGTYGPTPAGDVTPNGGTGEYEIYDALDLLLGTNYTTNASFDSLEYTGNTSVWTQGSNNSGFTVIGLGAGATNSVETYNPSSPLTTLVNPIGAGFTGDGSIGLGTKSSPFLGAGSSLPAGTQFGIALQQVYNGTTTNYFSNTTLNADGMDHMIVYNLSQLDGTTIYIENPVTGVEEPLVLQDPYLIAFEDTIETNSTTGSPSDVDYNDLMVLVDGATPFAPVPEPTTWALLIVGLAGMGLFAVRRQFALVK